MRRCARTAGPSAGIPAVNVPVNVAWTIALPFVVVSWTGRGSVCDAISHLLLDCPTCVTFQHLCECRCQLLGEHKQLGTPVRSEPAGAHVRAGGGLDGWGLDAGEVGGGWSVVASRPLAVSTRTGPTVTV